MESYTVPGLTEAVARAIDDHNWRPVGRLFEHSLPEDSVEYTQLQQITVNGNIIKEACTGGFTELVSVFLNSGVQVDCIVDKSTGRTMSSNETMLHLAAKSCHVSLVKLLINVGADIECKTHIGKTPLFYAVEEGYLEVVKHLISVGADVNTCNKDGKTLLDAKHIYDTDTEEMLQLLLESGYDASKSHSCYPLYWAVSTDNIKYVKMLLEAGAHVNNTGRDTFNYKCYVPLHTAARCSVIPIMQLLLDYGADINARDEHGDTALHTAVKYGNLQSVEFLIEHGSLINSVNYSQKTPLSLSIGYKMFDNAMLLINSGAVIQHTVLHGAVYKLAPIHVIECLLEHGSNVTGLYNNKTALQYVISDIVYSSNETLHNVNIWKLQIAKLLLIYGSDHYVEDDYGNTVLHWACEKGDFELVKYLIYYGLNVNAKNIEGKKPYDIAREKGQTDIMKAIIHCHCNKYMRF